MSQEPVRAEVARPAWARFLRGAVIRCAIVLVLVLVPMLIAGLTGAFTPYRIGSAGGGAAFFITILTIVVPIARENLPGKGRLALVGGFLLLLGIYLSFVAYLVQSRRRDVDPPLLPEERQLLVELDGRLVHPALGFSLEHPGESFQYLVERSRQLGRPSSVFHVYDDGTDVVTIGILKTGATTAAHVEAIQRGIVEGIRHQGRAAKTALRIESQTTETILGRSTLTVRGRLDERVHLLTRAWLHVRSSVTFMILVQGLSASPDRFEALARSFTEAPPT